MKIVNVVREKFVPKTKKELAHDEEEIKRGVFGTNLCSNIKKVKMKEPVYIVEMSMEELRLVSFYLELEKRKPIVNIDITKE